MNQQVRKAETNAARPILTILEALKNAPRRSSMGAGFALALPYRMVSENEVQPEELLKVELYTRLATLRAALKELQHIVEVEDCERITARQAVAAVQNLLTAIPEQMPNGIAWVQNQVTPEVLAIFRNLAHYLPHDRVDVVGSEIEELMLAVGALRALLGDPRTSPKIAKPLIGIVSMLEQAIIDSRARGAERIGDAMAEWKRYHHSLAHQAKIGDGGENFEEVRSAYEAVGEKALKIIDHVLRVHGLAQLSKDTFALLSSS